MAQQSKLYSIYNLKISVDSILADRLCDDDTPQWRPSMLLNTTTKPPFHEGVVCFCYSLFINPGRRDDEPDIPFLPSLAEFLLLADRTRADIDRADWALIIKRLISTFSISSAMNRKAHWNNIVTSFIIYVVFLIIILWGDFYMKVELSGWKCVCHERGTQDSKNGY